MGWYNVGTVTATNNSGTITGAGTAFISNIRVGDGITVAGSTSLHEVTNIVSETQLTVSPVYGGTTGSGKTYGVVPIQGYVQGLADQAKQLVLSYGNVLLSSGAYDTTPGRLLRVGDFGIGSTDLIDYGGDLNALTAAGFYLVATPATNMPSGHAAGFLTVKANGSNLVIQTFESQGTTTCFERCCGGGSWSAWRLRYNQSSILGTVSQSGGIPTGAVIETATNANGTYIKYADGTLVCYALSPILTWAANNSVTATWTFPVAFISNPRTFGQMQTASPHAYNGAISPNSNTSATVSGGGIYAVSGYVSMLALGRWF